MRQRRLALLIFAQAALCATLLPALSLPEEVVPDTLSLTEVVKKTMALYFASGSTKKRSVARFARELAVAKPYQRPAGVFVTLSHGGKPRACWGSIFPEHGDIVKSTVYATLGALTREYRYPPIDRKEWTKLKPQVTVIRAIEPITSMSEQNPLRQGLMIRSGGKSGVILPGEARDSHYQLVMGKLKAGIKPGEPYQLYTIRADIYE